MTKQHIPFIRVTSDNRGTAKKLVGKLSSLSSDEYKNMALGRLGTALSLIARVMKNEDEIKQALNDGAPFAYSGTTVKLAINGDKRVHYTSLVLNQKYLTDKEYKQIFGRDKDSSSSESSSSESSSSESSTKRETSSGDNTITCTGFMPEGLQTLGALGQSIWDAITTHSPSVDADKIAEQVNTATTSALQSIQAQVNEACSKLAPKGIEIKVNGKTKHESKEYHHFQFDEVLTWIQIRPVYLFGEASGGKTTVYGQLGDALGSIYDYDCKVYQTMQLFTQHEVQGYLNVEGVYINTIFFDWFKNGGLLCCDELDRSMPKALTILNSMLENGKFMFPNGEMVYIHEHAFFIGSGNTALNGSGANSRYNAAESVDGATVDRFIGINFKYDEHIERIMCADNLEWLDMVRKIRKSVADLGIDLLVSTRPIRDGAQGLANGVPLLKVIDYTIMKGLPDEQAVKILVNAGIITTETEWQAR